MEESEKMRVLKKAYAEIILSTAKEAAARIMVSEKRVQQVNRDLSYTKDEAFRLLLRLKQTMDSKLNETEMKSLHQQRRIEELEAQLQDAEDIASNLRLELNEAHIKIEEIEKNQKHNWPNMMEKAACERVIPDDVLATHPAIGDCTTTDSLGENRYVGVPDVPSGIVRNKKLEVCVNGCTQRVHAYERVGVDDLKDGKTSREDEDGKIYKKPLVGSDVAHVVGEELVNVVDVNNMDIFSCTGRVSKAFHKRRKCASRRRRSGKSLLKSLPSIDKEARCDLPNSQNCLPSSHDMLESHNDEVKGKQPVPPSTAPSNVSEMGELSEHVVVDGVAKAQTNEMEEDEEVSRSLVLIRERNGSGDCSDVAHSNPELETNNVSSTNSDGKLQNLDEDFPNLRPKDRLLKYTFQRKRKKEALSSDDSSLVSQENPVKRKAGKKHNS